VRYPNLSWLLLVLLGVLCPVHQASAQTRICSLPIADFAKRVDTMDADLKKVDLKETQIEVELMDKDWMCLDDPVPPRLIARYAHVRALLAFMHADPDEALRWNRAAAYADPSLDWPDWIPEGHPIRHQLEMADEMEITTVQGKYLANPNKGGIFLDGRFATEPKAPEEVPVLMQVFDKKQAKLGTEWLDGPNFPRQWVTDDAKAAKA